MILLHYSVSLFLLVLAVLLTVKRIVSHLKKLYYRCPHDYLKDAVLFLNGMMASDAFVTDPVSFVD